MCAETVGEALVTTLGSSDTRGSIQGRDRMRAGSVNSALIIGQLQSHISRYFLKRSFVCAESVAKALSKSHASPYIR